MNTKPIERKEGFALQGVSFGLFLAHRSGYSVRPAGGACSPVQRPNSRLNSTARLTYPGLLSCRQLLGGGGGGGALPL